MDLYSLPLSCSLAVHLVLEEHGITPDLHWLERGPGRRLVGDEIASLNAKRKSPTLVLDDGTVLTEVMSVLDYLDERFQPARDASERRRRLEWLSFLATDLHQPVLAPLFDPAASDITKDDVVERLLPPAIAHLASALRGRHSLLDRPCAADAFTLWVLLLLRHRVADRLPMDAVGPFIRHAMDKPHVQAVVARERAAYEARS